MNDLVNHPSHYNKAGHKECIEEMIDLYGVKEVGIWCKLTAYKYRYRHGLKENNPDKQDLAKEEWYMNKYHELMNRKDDHE